LYCLPVIGLTASGSVVKARCHRSLLAIRKVPRQGCRIYAANGTCAILVLRLVSLR
jgi:hypothetical protein